MIRASFKKHAARGSAFPIHQEIAQGYYKAKGMRFARVLSTFRG